MFLNCSTCFGRHTAHHQELKNCNCSLWFYIRLWLLVAAMPSQRPATINVCKTRGCNYSFWAPDDGQCHLKHVEQLRNNGIINSTTWLHLVGSFYEIYITMHRSMNITCLGTYLAQTLWMPSLLGMILWFADVLLLHQKTPFSYSKSWHGLVQCSDQQWTCTVVPVVLHQLRVCYHFRSYQSNRTYFASMNHCSHTVLKVFNGFMPLVHMQPTKTRLLNADCLWNIWQVEWPY